MRDQMNAIKERILVLEAGRADLHYWRDLWAYRELFAILAWRDLAVRYKQTAIGVAWALIRPLLTGAIFTVVVGRVAELSSDGAARYAPWLSSACSHRALLPHPQRSLVQPG